MSLSSPPANVPAFLLRKIIATKNKKEKTGKPFEDQTKILNMYTNQPSLTRATRKDRSSLRRMFENVKQWWADDLLSSKYQQGLVDTLKKKYPTWNNMDLTLKKALLYQSKLEAILCGNSKFREWLQTNICTPMIQDFHTSCSSDPRHRKWNLPKSRDCFVFINSDRKLEYSGLSTYSFINLPASSSEWKIQEQHPYTPCCLVFTLRALFPGHCEFINAVVIGKKNNGEVYVSPVTFTSNTPPQHDKKDDKNPIKYRFRYAENKKPSNFTLNDSTMLRNNENAKLLVETYKRIRKIVESAPIYIPYSP